MKLKILLALGLAAFAFGSSFAQAPVTLDDCFRAALKQSQTLAGQREVLAQAEEHYRQALSVMLPQVAANFTSFSQDTSSVPQQSGAAVTTTLPNQSTAKIAASMPLFRGFGLMAALAQTNSLSAAQKQAYRAAVYQLYSDTSNAFYLVMSLENDLKILRKESDLYRDRIGELQARVAIGRSRPTEVLTVQAALAALAAQIEQVRAQIATARELLSFLTGLPAEAELNDTGAAPADAGALESYTAGIEDLPGVKFASLNAEAADHAVGIATGNLWPSVDAAGDYYLGRPAGALQNSRWDSTITISQPLFAGGYNVSKLAEARSLLKQRQADYQNAVNLARQNINSSYQQVSYDLRQTAKFNEAVDLAERNYRAVSDDYANGLVTNLDVLQALASLQDISRSYNSSSYALKMDYNKLLALSALVKLPEAQTAK
jgi:outer membrane protein